MPLRRHEDLVVWQLANAFKKEVYSLIRGSPAASCDFSFRDQARRAAASVEINVCEGFYRYGAREFCRFLSIALASLSEASQWLHDGVDRQHFAAADCETALNLAKRCRVAMLRLRSSLQPFARNGRT